MLICAVVFLFALYKVVDILMEYKQIDDFYDGAQEESVDLDSQGRVNDILLSSLIAENSDVKGWIYIEDTEISYPILQGPNNQYYLYRAYNKQYLGAGSIFLESLNSPDFTDSHTIIFGHNMHNGSMFGQLDKFFDEEYRNDHSHVYIKLPDGTWNVYEIFAMYTAGIQKTAPLWSLTRTRQNTIIIWRSYRKRMYTKAHSRRQTEKGYLPFPPAQKTVTTISAMSSRQNLWKM